LVEGILKLLQNGRAVSYRQPGWDERGRPGAIDVAAGLDLVIVEGVDASSTEVRRWIDRALWVESDLEEAECRGIARDGGTEEARDFWREWSAQEFDFLQRQRPWERATLIVTAPRRSPTTRALKSCLPQPCTNHCCRLRLIRSAAQLGRNVHLIRSASSLFGVKSMGRAICHAAIILDHLIEIFCSGQILSKSCGCHNTTLGKI
jgi:hypothetical protein